MKKLSLIAFVFISHFCFSQKTIQGSFTSTYAIDFYPKSWWIGMKNPTLQVMVRAKDIAKGWVGFDLKENPGVMLDSIQKTKNPNYLFLNFRFRPSAKLEKISVHLHSVDTTFLIEIPLEKEKTGKGETWARGVQSQDFIYLIMPDRFSNGDPTNDRFSGLYDTVTDRSNPLLRHGGDLQGITNHLDYLQNLGVTTLWLTPVIENDMPLEKETAGWMSGYHGYWFTDHYAIDKRMGGEEAYLKLVSTAHQKGMKIIQDAVYNHIGEKHWIMTDPPDETWINQWPSYQGTSHREQAIFDIHAAKSDKEIMGAGWFVPHLPDLNLRNPLLATYLIQQAIWMTETFQLDGWRVDTYKYCDEHFLNNLNAALYREFPELTTLAESTVSDAASGAYFCRNNLNVSFKSNGTGILDFPVSSAILESLKKNYGWSDGVMRLYTTLAEDMLYQEPMNNCIFLDNHDMDRFFSVAGENLDNYKMGIGLLLTQRGIPHLYYGTEILMKNFKSPSDAMVRDDFPGGFPGDLKNKFLASDRTEQENKAFDFVSTLSNFRKSSSALCKGKMMHYIPSKGVYTYARYDSRQTILTILNTDTTTATIHFNDFSERTRGFKTATDVMNGQVYPLDREMIQNARSIRIMELK